MTTKARIKREEPTVRVQAAMDSVEDDLEITEQEMDICARVGITREELIQQKAMDKLNPNELRLMRTGLTPVEILAARIVR